MGDRGASIVAKLGLIVLAVVVLLWLSAEAPLPAQEPGDRDRFLRDYETGVKPLKDFYSNVRLRARIRTDSTRGPTPEPVEWEYVFLGNGPRLRLDEFGIIGRGSVVGWVEGGEDAASFGVYKSSPEDRYRIDRYRDKGPYPFFEKEFIRQLIPAPYDTYCTCNGIEILEFLRWRQVTIQSVRRETSDSESLIRVTYEWSRRRRGGEQQKVCGWFLFAPDDCWALREYLYDYPAGNHRKKIEYKGRRNGIPLVCRIEAWDEDEAGHRLGSKIVEVLELVPGLVPASEFSLAAYSLGEADLPGRVPSWFYYQLVAVVVVVVGILVWTLMRRHPVLDSWLRRRP